jgi:hypothetical protein
VKKHLKGGPVSYDALDKHLLVVYDQDAIDKKTGNKGGYRSINLDQIVRFKISGTEYVVKGGAKSESVD